MLSAHQDNVTINTEAGDNPHEPNDIFDEREIAEAMATMWEVFKHISKASLPMMGTATLPTQFFIFGMVLIHLAEDESALAATALIFKMFGFLLISLSPVFGGSVVLRNQLGELKKAEEESPHESHQEKYDSISATAKSMMITTTVTSPVSFFPFYFADSVLEALFRQDDLLSVLARPFLRVYSTSVPGQAVRMPMLQLLYGFSKAVPAALISLSSLGLTTLLGLALSYGWFGNTPMGRIGMAIGASIEPYLTAGGYMMYVRFHPDFARFHFLSSRNHPYVLRQLKAVARIGLPISASLVADIGSDMTFGAMIGLTGGKEALVTTSVLNQLNSFMAVMRPSLAHTVSLKLSSDVGHHEFKQASNFARKGLLTTAIYTTPIPLISAVAPDVLVFMSGKQIPSMTFMRQLAPILGWTQIMEGLRMSLMSQLHAFNDNNIPAIISISCTAGGVIIGSITGIYTDGKSFALTSAYAAGLTIAAFSLGKRWYDTSKPEQLAIRQQQQAAIYQSSPSFTLFKCCKRKKKEEIKLLPSNGI